LEKSGNKFKIILKEGKKGLADRAYLDAILRFEGNVEN
jgi:hypothetical protein